MVIPMTFRELLSRFSLDELWYYLSMRHGLQHKPIKASILRELYGLARSELLAIELDQGTPFSELSCDFCSEKNDEWDEAFFDVTLKENEKTYSIDFLPWKDIIDLPVSQRSLDRYGEFLCAAEILWEVTFYGYSAQAVASEGDGLQKSIGEAESGKTDHILFDPDEYKNEVDPHDVKATLDWFANAPEYVKRSVRNCISADVIRDEDDDQSAVAKTIEKFEKFVGDELKTEDIVDLPLRMIRGLDIDDAQLLLESLNGKCLL
jgi:hypothetical protein